MRFIINTVLEKYEGTDKIATIPDGVTSIGEETYNKVYKGIFWIKDINEFEKQCVIKKIPVDIWGNIREEECITLELNSKNGDNYNHEASWAILPHSMTDGKNLIIIHEGE